MTGVYNDVAAHLWENHDLTQMWNIHCVCHLLVSACSDSSCQLSVLKLLGKYLCDYGNFSKTH